MDCRALVLLLLAAFLPSIGAAGEANEPSYAEDNDVLDGDLLKLRVNVDGFIPLGGTERDGKCARKGSVLSVTRDRNGKLSVRFKKVPTSGKDGMFSLEET